MPEVVSPVWRMLRKMMSPQIARIVPLAMGSRMITLSFQRGARMSSQSWGASAAETALLLYAMPAGVR